jgi:hypothetical protein
MKVEEIKENLIEEIFCKKFEKLKRHPMSEDLTKIMFSMYMADINNPVKEITDEFMYQLIDKRVKYGLTIKLDDWRLITFLMMVSGTPGKAVMYVTYLQYWAKKNNLKEITFDLFCEKIFPLGFPNDNDLTLLWDEQKGGKYNIKKDNLIDCQEALKSIQW